MSKNRQKTASQWFQAIISLSVLSCFYVSRGYFGAETTDSKKPNTPPIQVQQQEYWNGDRTGFASGQAEMLDSENAIVVREGVFYDRDGIRISFFENMETHQIEETIQSNLPRFYTQIDSGILLVEGDISSSSINAILDQIGSS